MSVEKVSVEDDIRAAMAEVEEKANEIDEAPIDEKVIEIPEREEEKPVKERDETGKFAKKTIDKPEAEAPEAPKVKEDAAPQSWGPGVKADWAKLPAPVRAEIQKRESDIHQMMTRHDGELRLGRELKEVATPYMALIQAEGGGSLASVTQGLLNTAYQLRTSSPEQKAQVVRKICETYGIPLSQVTQSNQPQNQLPPELQTMHQKIAQMENDRVQEKQLQKQQEEGKVMSEIQAFAADPKNTHFEQVRTHMGALFGSGQAKDMREAYDQACWANPQIRSILIAAQEQAQAEKRKSEIAQKKKAAVSVTGSPGLNANATNPKQSKSVEDSVREVFDDVLASKI